MKKNVGITIAIALGLSALLLTIAFQAGWVQAKPFALSARGPAPAVISYQGQIFNGKDPFIGKGYFKFQVMSADGLTQYWSNDGFDPPDASIMLDVTNGLFSVNLGDTSVPGMSVAIDANTFSEPNALLRVWFSPDGSEPWTVMPDQVIASVPYALQAQQAISADSAGAAASAGNADTLDGSHALAFQDDVSSSCLGGQAIQVINDDGTILCADIPQAPRFSISQLHSGRFSEVKMVLGSDGLPFIVYLDNVNYTLRSFHCTDPLCTSGLPEEIATPGNYLNLDLAIGRDGFPLVSFEKGNSSSRVVLLIHCNDLSCFSRTSQTIGSGTNPSLAVGPVFEFVYYGFPHIPEWEYILQGYFGTVIYVGWSDNKLMRASCQDITCGTIETEIENDNVAGTIITATDIVFGPDADYVAFALFSGEIKIYKGGSLLAEFPGSKPEMFMGLDNSPIVVFHNAGLNVLDLDAYAYENGVYLNGINLDPNAIGGYSIVLGADGLPLISYVDIGQALKVAHCADIACTTAHISTLNTRGNVRTSTALVIGMDGFGMIVYPNSSDDTLGRAHCTNNFCNPNY